jgi:hypothetical protein
MLQTVTQNVTNTINKRLSDRQNALNQLNTDLSNQISRIPADLAHLTVTKRQPQLNELISSDNYYRNKNLDFDIPIAAATTTTKPITVEGFDNAGTTTTVPLTTKQTTTTPQTTQQTTTTSLTTKQSLPDIDPLDYIGTYKFAGGQYHLFTTANLELNIDVVKFSVDGELYATYSVINIAASVDFPNTVEVLLGDINVQVDKAKFLAYSNILKQLGVQPPCKLFLTRDVFKSAQNVTHISYRLANSTYDTIMYLDKIA